MHSFHLSNDFMDGELERQWIATVLRQPELRAGLPAGAIVVHQQAWKTCLDAMAEGKPLPEMDFGVGVEDPGPIQEKLIDLYQRRVLADAQQRLALALYDPKHSAGELALMMERESENLKVCVRESSNRNSFTWGKDLLDRVLEMARERSQRQQQSGAPCMGLATGFKRLDQILNGFNAGLHVLAAGPGAGKTTLALQWANVATQAGAAVLYVTYENSPANLVLKLLASVAGISGVEIERGYGDMRKIEEASRKLEPALSRLAILEGNSKLSLAQIHSRVRQTQEAQGREDVLVVVDYLQRAAHQKGYDQLRHSVSAIAGELREMANQCGVPVLAISSQNRAGGDYGRNAGSVPNLDSLKESGDLEYAADTAMFLCPEPDVKVTAPARAMKLVVLKNRFGGIGSVPLIFRPDTGVYREAQQGILGQG